VYSICEKEKCTGCGACAANCLKNAISMQEDEKGFSYPVISENCVECGLCKKTCPQISNKIGVNDGIKSIYAAFTKDEHIRSQSSSGGLFTELASYIIGEKGIVFASRFECGTKRLVFDSCENIEDLKKFRGSKYLQSSTGLAYIDIKKELKTGRKVMFVGTACQVSGLKNFLGKDYANLFCVDIICHGVPSPKIWSEYVDMLERQYKSNAVSASFRYKRPSWTQFSLKVEFENKKEYIRSKFDDPYLISFLKEMSIRENCYSCPYTNTMRMGDITLADFWGYKSTSFKMRNNEKGISLVLINNEKGNMWFNAIKDRLMWTEKSLKEAISGNRSLKEPWKKNSLADSFWECYLQNGDLEVAFSEYCKPYRFPVKMKINWFILNHLYLVPKFILRKKGLIK